MSVRIEDGGAPGIVSLIFENPPANVLTLTLIDEITEAIDSLDPETVALLIRSTGRTFSAGVDVAVHTPERAPEMLERFHGLIRRLIDLPAIPIAIVQGPALGGGCELALVCDLVVAAPEATFGQPEIGVGCYPPVAAALLPERIGPPRANDMVYSGRPIDAADAAAIGLVSRLAPTGGLDAEVAALVDDLAARSRAVLRVTREAMIGPRRRQMKERLEACERIYLERLLRTDDVAEGVRAFEQKRPPRWRHR